jgi:hypothetical protein
MKTKILFIMAVSFSLPVFLNLPLLAQSVKQLEKFNCPYCDMVMVNVVTRKFCGVCGAKLSYPMWSFSANGKGLTVSNLGMRTPDISFVNDYTATKMFGNSKDFPSERRQGSVAWPIVGGILAGGAGFLAGGYIGASFTFTPNADFSSIGGFIVGAPIGEMICLPIGVHLGNGRRGSFPLVFLASLGIAGTGIAVTAALDDYRAPAITLPITALTQLIACVAIERTTGHSR